MQAYLGVQTQWNLLPSQHAKASLLIYLFIIFFISLFNLYAFMLKAIATHPENATPPLGILHNSIAVYDKWGWMGN